MRSLENDTAPPHNLAVTLRAGEGTWVEARALEARVLAERRVPCRVDVLTGAVHVNAELNATTLHVPGSEQELSPGPIGVLLATAVWQAALEATGGVPRPPPSWLLRFGCLRLAHPGAPLVTLASTTLLLARLEPRRGSLSPLLLPALLAACFESATELLLAARRAASARQRSGDTLVPAALTLLFVAAGAVFLEPVLLEMRRCGAALAELRTSPDDTHPLGPMLVPASERRGAVVTRAQAARMQAVAAASS